MSATPPPPGLYSIRLNRRRGSRIPPRAKGTYALWMHLNRRHQLDIGRLGRHIFAAKWFVYVGSAFGPGGLEARIRHHLGDSPSPRWHIDYLTRIAFPSEVWITLNPKRWEHPLAQWLQRLEGGDVALPGFGCSDCRCRSHLFEFRYKPRLSLLIGDGDCGG